jgi:hypothetical protein
MNKLLTIFPHYSIEKYMKRHLIFCALSWLALMALPPLAVHADEPSDNFLNRLSGVWKAEGMAFGMEAKFHMQWAWVLQNRFIQLSYKIEMRGKDGQPRIFEGTAFYKPGASGKYEGTWFDSQRSIHPIEATADSAALTSFWGKPETEQGKSVYRLLDENRIEVVDAVRAKDGSWREFSRNTFAREQ